MRLLRWLANHFAQHHQPQPPGPAPHPNCRCSRIEPKVRIPSTLVPTLKG